jgi:quercetin dioxygenase-like cupin family protein
MNKLVAAGAATVLVAVGLTGSSATAAPPPPANAPSATPAVGGILSGPQTARQDGISLKVRDDTLVRTFTITYSAGDFSGWHQHPGIVLATVEKGVVVQQVGCQATRRSAGQSFTEVAPHQVSNPATDTSAAGDAVLRITQLVPAGETAFRDEAREPACWRKRPLPTR